MTVVVVTPPDVATALPLATVKAHLVVEHDGDDGLIGALRDAAFAHLDGPAGWLGRALAPQTLELWLDGWPCAPFELPFGPISEIEGVEYTDTAGVEQTLAGDLYRLTASGALDRAHGASWPSARSQSDAVCITYAAGYASLPSPVQAAMLLMIGDLYAHREAAALAGANPAPRVTGAVMALLSPFRVWKL